ncbi:hypothetical protein CCR80_13970 [Rhodothalassium salexigens]|uniref:hypothetical protein n=1 Tax=Rhodothalassium salexigens TaxID=1086 RepID=UPI0019147CC9|nr:hypothetical protein [Rhodothalassium salexigens]MBK5922143.1 hypothetical protein [Rhodothalassium salexigens]
MKQCIGPGWARLAGLAVAGLMVTGCAQDREALEDIRRSAEAAAAAAERNADRAQAAALQIEALADEMRAARADAEQAAGDARAARAAAERIERALEQRYDRSLRKP